MKKDVLENKIFNDWQDSINHSARLENIITERLSYIVHTIYNIFGYQVDTWYFEDAKEGEVGDLNNNIYNGIINNIIVECKSLKKEPEILIIDKNGSEWEKDLGIPVRWLFENFEQEVIDGKKKFEEKEAARKAKNKEQSAKQKLEDQQLINSAKSKLSKNELAALRRSL